MRFTIGLSLVSVYSYFLTEDNALQHVTDQAELIMQEAVAARKYTVDEFGPLLNQNSEGKFFPQTVLAYSATQIANLVSLSRPDYSYREAVFNPTNPRDKATATPAEEKIINQLIADPSLAKLFGNQYINGVWSLYISYPIRITNSKCLVCHSTPEAAPAAMRAIYGDKNGFGWKFNEVVGTQMVVAPYTLPADLAKKTFSRFIISLSLLFVIMFIVINISIRHLVLKPVRRVSPMVDEASKGNLTDDELKVTGNDEISEMLTAFNRMRRSIVKIVELLRKNKADSKSSNWN